MPTHNGHFENNSSDMFDQNLSTISIANNDDEFYSIPDNEVAIVVH